MTSEQKPPKLIFTVLLVNGEKISHTYDVPLDRKKAVELVDYMAEMIVAAMTHRKETYLYFMNPSISYNPDNVLGVKLDAFEAKELEEAMKKAQKKAGFIKD